MLDVRYGMCTRQMVNRAENSKYITTTEGSQEIVSCYRN